MFKYAGQLNVQAVNWHDQDTDPDLATGRSQLQGAACGGLSQWKHLHNGTPSEVREAVREATRATNSRRFILSTGCVTMITSPTSNLWAVREAVEQAGN